MNEVRIIGGLWKRRKLQFPNRPELRPTPDRMRVTLFNWLAALLDGARCLDLFAGSGALGFEAASRGAGAVTLIERDAQAIAALRESRTKLGADRCEIVKADATEWLARDRSCWDVVFLDPPFDGPLLTRSLALLARDHRLHASSRVYIEFRRDEAPPLDADWAVEKATRAGDSSGRLLRWSHAG